MKKLILSALVVSSLLATSCKKAKEAGGDLTNAATTVVEEGKNAVAEGATTVADGAKNLADKAASAVGLEGVEIPEFKDPKVGAYLTEYSAYAKEYIAAGADGYKNTDLMKKGTDLNAKTQEIVKSLGTDSEAKQKFSTTLSAITSKMAPAVAK